VGSRIGVRQGAAESARRGQIVRIEMKSHTRKLLWPPIGKNG
jgi:hypothetical protein